MMVISSDAHALKNRQCYCLPPQKKPLQLPSWSSTAREGPLGKKSQSVTWPVCRSG